MDLSKLMSVDDVSKFLIDNGIPQEFTVVLKDNYIDGLEFRELEYQDLLLMLPGKLGIVKKIWRLIKHYYDQFGIENSLNKKENVVEDVMQVINIRQDNADPLSPARDIVSTSKVNITSPTRNECTDREVFGESSPVSSENIPKTPVSDSSSIDVAVNEQQSSPLARHMSKELLIPSLPCFSSRVRAALKSNKISLIYDAFVAEAAYDLISKGDIVNDRRLYELYSKKMFKKYPCIGVPGGRKEWSRFSKKLSGKLRYLRWKQQKDEKEMPFLKRRKSLRKIASKEKKLKLDDYLVNEDELGEPCFEEDSANWLEEVVYVPIKQEVQDGEEFAFGRGELDVTLHELDDKLEDANNDPQRTGFPQLTEFMNKVMSNPMEDGSPSDFQKTDQLHVHEAVNFPQDCDKISVTYGDLTKRVIINRECIKSTIEIIKKKFQLHSLDKIRIEGKIDDVEDYIALNPEDDEDIQELKKCTKLRIKRTLEADITLPKLYSPLHTETSVPNLLDATSVSSASQKQAVDSCSSRTTEEFQGHNLFKKGACYVQDHSRTINPY